MRWEKKKKVGKRKKEKSENWSKYKHKPFSHLLFIFDTTWMDPNTFLIIYFAKEVDWYLIHSPFIKTFISPLNVSLK